MNAAHALEPQSARGLSRAAQPVSVGNIGKHRVDGLNSGGARGVHHAGSRILRLAAFGSSGHAEVGSVVLESDGEGGHIFGDRGDRKRVLNSERGFENGHDPDGTDDAMAEFQFADHAVHFCDLLWIFDLGHENQVGTFGDDVGQVFESERQLVDANHALAIAKVDGA